VEIGANRNYLLAGFVTGPLFGALGGWVGRRYRRHVGLIVGSLTAGEIAVVALVQGHQLLPSPLYFEWSVDDWAGLRGGVRARGCDHAGHPWRRHGPTAFGFVPSGRS
jgi:hypothetical protein